MTTEPTQLHYITGDELKLLLNFRLLSPEAQLCITLLTESQANSRIQYDGNVVPIRPAGLNT